MWIFPIAIVKMILFRSNLTLENRVEIFSVKMQRSFPANALTCIITLKDKKKDGNNCDPSN